MKEYQKVFARSELKYLITEEQKEIIEDKMYEYMRPDEYTESLICGMYFDTPSYLLIRRSIEKPIYKEKLRIRSYGIPDHDSRVFVEIKKKFNHITYKRRIGMTEEEAMDYLWNKKSIKNPSQITKEIGYFCDYYQNLAPSMYISYERSAFFAKDGSGFRMTFDKNILWRDFDLSLTDGSYGEKILNDNEFLMEIKIPGGMPLWISQLLTENEIYKTSFSKYGKAYMAKTGLKVLGGIHCVR